MGGRFDFGPLSTTAIERAEVYRGPNSSLYGADAASSVVSLTTPHGTTSFPSLLFQGDAGNFSTSREEVEVAGAHNKLDYLGAFSWLQTVNDLPMDEYHVATAAANLGWQPSANTQIRGTLHYGVDATGVPNAWDFYHVTDSATEKDQDLFISASLDNQTTPDFHNTLRYGATRKREQYSQWAQRGSIDSYGDGLGNLVTITGANGYSVTGQAVLDFGGPLFSAQYVNNRDQLVYQGDYRFTPHLSALIGFHYEDERGVENLPSYFTYEAKERTNYDYLAAVHGDYKNRFFYTLAGSLERYSLFGTQTSPRAGLVFYAVRPRKGIFSGTRILFNYGDGVREPKLTDQFGSLYQILQNLAPGDRAATAHRPAGRAHHANLRRGPGAGLLRHRLIFRASYFHNQFGRELEPLSVAYLSLLFPNYTAAQLQQLTTVLSTNYVFDIMTNTQAFRAQGAEVSVESGLGAGFFIRGGYSYTDAVIQRSFTSDNEALLGGYGFNYGGIPLGAVSPLVGARPFRRRRTPGSWRRTTLIKN